MSAPHNHYVVLYREKVGAAYGVYQLDDSHDTLADAQEAAMDAYEAEGADGPYRDSYMLGIVEVNLLTGCTEQIADRIAIMHLVSKREDERQSNLDDNGDPIIVDENDEHRTTWGLPASNSYYAR